VELVEDTTRGAGSKTPTRWSAVIFAIKVRGLRAQRWVHDLDRTARSWPIERHPKNEWKLRYELRSRLWSDVDKREREFELGKVENLRRACSRLNGIVIDAGGTFSFWRQIGRASRQRGFVVGRMLQQGCVVPAVGGGLCQLSNALYGLALKSGCEIVERHAHSIKMPDAPAHDATVAWNYVDLRFRVQEQTRIKAWMSGEELIVEWQTGGSSVFPSPGYVRLEQIVEPRALQELQSCASCGVTDCFRHEAPRAAAEYRERTAYLVDSDLPEFEEYVQRVRRPGDVLVSKDIARSHSAERMAVKFAQSLRPDVTHLCVSQTLLPWLWRMGAMGGRTFDVFMTSPPTRVPEAVSDPWLVRDEEEALTFARRLIFQVEMGAVSAIQMQPETIGA
jgi:hypothetical protein